MNKNIDDASFNCAWFTQVVFLFVMLVLYFASSVNFWQFILLACSTVAIAYVSEKAFRSLFTLIFGDKDET